MVKHLPHISIEKYAAYLDGNLPEEEMQQMKAFIDTDADMQAVLEVDNSINSLFEPLSLDENLLDELIEHSFVLPDIGSGTYDEKDQSFVDFFHDAVDRFIDRFPSMSLDNTNIHNEQILEAMNEVFEAPGIHGEMNPIQQHYSDTCAIKSQQIILNDFGIPCTEEELIQFSHEQGWYNGDGTSMIDVGNLLETAGIPCSRQADANIFNLVDELSQGHKIIVGVDADELWKNDSILDKLKNWFNDFFRGDTPNHALIVAGIDTSDPNNIQVIVTDPGTGDYCKSYPLDQFMDAWSDSNCYMVSTDVAMPQTLPQMANFPDSIGHIESVAGVDYADFQIFNDMSYGIPTVIYEGEAWLHPMDSFMHSYFDYAHDDIMFDQIFNSDYLFNDYINHDSVMPQFHNTFDYGMTQIHFDPSNDWDHYAEVNNISMMTNFDYSNFLDQSIADFQMMGDFESVHYCEQQMMMLDYCNHFGFDFYDTFYDSFIW